ncbi:MAG TPA: hypothetical protein VN736_29340 [Candidatus Limnocylindrales bacterium]|nr:hypothetical protein [Candidatus Limnocylindrales bacterium]
MGSAITNFTSVVEAKSLGTADIDKITQAIDKQSAAIDNLGKKADELKQHASGFAELGERIKTGLENPLQAVKSAAEDVLNSLGPLGKETAVTGGIFLAAGAAALEAAKGVGEFGIRVRDVQLRTGLSAKQVGEFSYAAKAAGTDVSAVERAMRGLTAAIEDQGEKGAAGRDWLRRFGIDLAEVRDGTAPTAEVLMKISEGLERLPTQWERNKAAIDIFKKAGIDLLPFFVELRQNLSVAEGHDLGFSNGDIQRFSEAQGYVALIQQKWEEFKVSAKEGVLISVQFIGDAAKWVKDRLGETGLRMGGARTPDASFDAQLRLFADIEAANQGRGRWGSNPQSGLQGLFEQRMKVLENLKPLDALGSSGNGQVQAALRQAADLEKQIEDIQNAGIAAQKKAADDKRKADEEQDYAVKNHVARLNEQMKAAREAEKQLEAFEREMATKDLGPVAGIFLRQDELVKAGAPKGRTTNAALQGAAAALHKEAEEDNHRMLEMNLSAAKLAAQPWEEEYKGLDRFNKGILKQITDQVNAYDRANREIDSITLGAERGNIQRRASRTQGLMDATLGPGHEGEAIQSAYLIRLGLAQQLYDFDMERAKNDEKNARTVEQLQQARIDKAHAEADIRKEMGDADLERELKLADLQRQRLEDFKSLTVEAFNSLLQGPKGIENLLRNQAMKVADTLVGNAAGMAWPTVEHAFQGAHAKQGSTLGKLFAGTFFGPDPAKESALSLNAAGTHLDASAAALMEAARMLAVSPSGGGGGFSPASWSSAASKGFGIYTKPDGNVSVPGMDGGGGDAGGVDAYGDEGYDVPDSAYNTGTSTPAWTKAAGYGAAIAGSGYGIYSGISRGGARGALSAAGGAAALAGTIATLAKISKLAGPIGDIVGIGLSLLPMFFSDPKQVRQKQESDTLLAAHYTEPTSTTYSVDRYGHSYDSDLAGGARPIVQIAPGAIQFSAFDMQNFMDRKMDFADAMSTVLEGAMSARLATNLKSAVLPPK